MGGGGWVGGLSTGDRPNGEGQECAWWRHDHNKKRERMGGWWGRGRGRWADPAD